MPFFVRLISFFCFGRDSFQPLKIKCLTKEDPKCFVVRSSGVSLKVFESSALCLISFFDVSGAQ